MKENMMTGTLTILQGLPASGKSTWAREHADDRTVVVSMDGIRRMLVGGNDLQKSFYGPAGLATRNAVAGFMVAREYRRMAADWLRMGFDVIADAQNLLLEDVMALVEKCGESADRVRVVAFSVPLDTLLARNAARPEGARVPEDYIREQFDRWGRMLETDDMPPIEGVERETHR